jgi:uncharacterized GH25 family protein
MPKHILHLGLTLGLMALFHVLQAHECWLMPASFFLQTGEKTKVLLLVGEHFKGENWGGKSRRTRKLMHYATGWLEDLTSRATASDSNHLEVTFLQEGTHLLTLESHNSFISLEADKFNAYLKEDGIANILELRTRQKRLDSNARELYQRCAKTLVQVGKKNPAVFARQTQMPLDILPLQNPYALLAGEKLSLQVLFLGKPLPGYVVRSWYKPDQDAPTQEGLLRTDASGKVQLSLRPGYWMVSLVKMQELNNRKEADYQSYWGSLTFAVASQAATR